MVLTPSFVVELGSLDIPPSLVAEQHLQSHLDALGLIQTLDLVLSSLFLLFYNLIDWFYSVFYSYYTPFDEPLHMRLLVINFIYQLDKLSILFK